MKKLLFTNIFLFATFTFVNSQIVYDFSDDPLMNGWVYYDDYNSSPYPGFVYDQANGRINYQLMTGVDASILHTQLPSTLSTDYCVSFAIHATEDDNLNTFFPLVLTPYELVGTDLHPWRQNPSGSSAGGIQNIDFLAVEVLGDELRLFSKNDDVYDSQTIQPMSPAFHLESDQTYWVKLEIENSTTAIMSVYEDGGFETLLESTTYTIPLLDDMNHLYIANSNGNSSCSQFGYLDDYSINNCSGLGLTEKKSNEKELVRIIDFLGRDTEYKENIPLILIYSDGTREKVLKN